MTGGGRLARPGAPRKAVEICTVSGRKRAFPGVFGPFRARKWPFSADSGQWLIRFREQIRTFRATVGGFSSILAAVDFEFVSSPWCSAAGRRLAGRPAAGEQIGPLLFSTVERAQTFRFFTPVASNSGKSAEGTCSAGANRSTCASRCAGRSGWRVRGRLRQDAVAVTPGREAADATNGGAAQGEVADPPLRLGFQAAFG
jgi:hypothetical protein